jgi:hypothetical protein
VQAIVDLDPLHQSQGTIFLSYSHIKDTLTILLVIASYGAALRLTFLSAAVWASLTLLLHVGLRLPRLGHKAK